MKRFFSVVFLVLFISFPVLGWDAFITTGGSKYRPWSSVPDSKSVVVHVARGEWGVVQVITRADSCVDNVDVDSSVPVSKAGRELSSPDIYRAYFHLIIVPSRADGEHGEWPDALIPKVDRYHHERRNVFPYDARLVSKAYNVFGFDKSSRRWVINRRNKAQVPPVIVGCYSGGEADYEVVITSSGSLGSAKFKWRKNNGTWSNESFVSDSPVPLDSNISLVFSEQNYSEDDEWEFFANSFRNEVSWIEVFVPEDAVPDNYTMNVTVSADGYSPITLRVVFVVYNVTIPRTSSIPVWYDSSRAMIRSGHYRDGYSADEKYRELYNDYIEEGLYNRITFVNLLPPVEWNGSDLSSDGKSMDYWLGVARKYVNGDWDYKARMSFLPIPKPSSFSSYHEVVYRGSFKEYDIPTFSLSYINKSGNFLLNETLLFDNGSARLVYNRSPCKVDEVDEFPANVSVRGNSSNATAFITKAVPSEFFMLQKLYEIIHGEGWDDKVINWLVEEPRWSGDTHGEPPPLWMTDSVLQVSETMQNILPGIRQVATEQKHDEWDLGIDGWIAAIVVCGTYKFSDCYDVDESKRWSYSACGSHYCGKTGGEDRLKFPTHIIDTSFSNLRGFYWLKENGRFKGDLYWHSVWDYVYAAHSVPIDPWDQIWDAGGNGDGTLLYPGRPDRVGGSSHIPISTYRIKAIRKGLEDFELFEKARSSGFDVDSVVHDVVGSDWYVYEKQPNESSMIDARREVLSFFGTANCHDGFRNGDEEGVDCGGSCVSCSSGPNESQSNSTTNNSTTNSSVNDTSGCYDVSCPGDVSCDFSVDVFDLTLVGSTYGCSEGSACWSEKSEKADGCSGDGVIDVEDLNCVSQNFGLSC